LIILCLIFIVLLGPRRYGLLAGRANNSDVAHEVIFLKILYKQNHWVYAFTWLSKKSQTYTSQKGGPFTQRPAQIFSQRCVWTSVFVA